MSNDSDVIVTSQQRNVQTTWRHDVTMSRRTMTSHHDTESCCLNSSVSNSCGGHRVPFDHRPTLSTPSTGI